MKNTGLQNRFPDEVRQQWHFWYDCMVCGKNRIDTLHHIISPTSQSYVKGKHNESVFNSCPIHNRVCHIGNEGYLHRAEVVTELLEKVIDALIWLGYEPNDNDRAFFETYQTLYSEKCQEMVKLKYGWGDSRKPL